MGSRGAFWAGLVIGLEIERFLDARAQAERMRLEIKLQIDKVRAELETARLTGPLTSSAPKRGRRR